MKAKYYIRCNRCGYVWKGRKSRKAVLQFIADDGVYSLCTDCICDIGNAETDEDKTKIIDEGKMNLV